MIKITNGLCLQLCTLIILYNIGFAKNNGNSINGKVLDTSSGEPIENVNVYIANTTWGSSTDKEGNFSIGQIPNGTHDLVVSVIGYEYKTKKIELKDGSKITLNFSLNPIIYESETTTVEGSVPTEWLEDLQFFKIYFLGQSDFAEECMIENSEVLDFSRPYDSIFEAAAIKPLHITNKALGYRLDCILISFVFDKSSNIYSWSIKPKFTELVPEDIDEQTDWIQNRIDAYEGSSNHFLRSFCTKSLPDQGFDIYKVAYAGQKVLRANWRTVLVDYNEYIESVHSSGNTILRFENFLHVVYNNNYVSWIGLNYTYLTLDEFGYPYEENPYQVFGEWAKNGIADLIPKNYISEQRR